MPIPRIYQLVELAEGSSIELDRTASNHAIRVLRLRTKDQLIVFNGQGGEYLAVIETVRRNSALIKIKTFHDISRESSLIIHLGQGVSRGERMDYVIQKAVELGATEITPLFTEYCNVKLTSDRLVTRLIHWQKVAISACEQSGRCIVPKINPPQFLEQWIRHSTGLCFVCHPAESIKSKLPVTSDNRMMLLIGPEGGLSNQEIKKATTFGFQILTLGHRILRTETATVVALTLLQHTYGDLHH